MNVLVARVGCGDGAVSVGWSGTGDMKVLVASVDGGTNAVVVAADMVVGMVVAVSVVGMVVAVSVAVGMVVGMVVAAVAVGMVVAVPGAGDIVFKLVVVVVVVIPPNMGKFEFISLYRCIVRSCRSN